MLWQTAIMYSGKHDFLDWIISATIHLENPANKSSFSGNINPDFITFLRHHIAHNDNQRVT